MLDGLEDQRSLTVTEKAFKVLVKQHLSNLLEAKRIYWKQRNTARWVKFGDENIGLFQAMATHSYGRNLIANLTLADGTTISNHEQKAGALWSSFRDRMGSSAFTSIQYDLLSLLQDKQLDPLEVLDIPLIFL